MPHTISIDNLYPSVDVSELCKVFGKYGSILSARVEVNKPPIYSYKGYLSFENPVSAACAVQEMNDDDCLGKRMLVKLELLENLPSAKCAVEEMNGMELPEKVNFKTSDTKVFVENYDNRDDCDFMKVFSKFGLVEDKNPMVFDVYCKEKSISVAKLYDLSSVEANNKKLVVEPYKIKEVTGPSSPTLEIAKEVPQKNLHVKNLPEDMIERDLYGLFEPYGNIKSLSIARDKSNISRGFGFVCFTNETDADKAKHKINKFLYKSKILEVNFNQEEE